MNGGLARQFTSPVIWLLLGASALLASLGELVDAVAIGAIVTVNAGIGFFQEYRAERAVMALRSMTAPQARVMRDGHGVIVPANTIVPGDQLVLGAGAAADARLHTAHALSTHEAALTGESTPVEKTTVPTAPDTPLAERHDFVFMGTSVSTGTGGAEVVATGMQTELGRIAHLLATAEETVTPLQRRLARVSQTLLYICGGIVVVVAVAGLLRGWPLIQVLMAAVSSVASCSAPSPHTCGENHSSLRRIQQSPALSQGGRLFSFIFSRERCAYSGARLAFRTKKRGLCRVSPSEVARGNGRARFDGSASRATTHMSGHEDQQDKEA